jgi:HSP20 family molecular chaperone IbpA
MRQFRLLDNVNVDGISTKMENDVLTMNAPKIKTDAVSNGDVKSIDIYASDKY